MRQGLTTLFHPLGPEAKNNGLIVVAFGPDVQAYIENEAHKQCPRPKQCPKCGALGRMTGHGSYGRKPKDLERAYHLRVKRWQCQACKGTSSCLPSFLLSYRHYLVRVIHIVLVQRLEVGGSWPTVVVRCSQEGLPALRTMQRWVAAFAEQTATWLPAVGRTLAEQDSHSPWLEARPPTAAAGQSMGTLLLTATLHLLAWAKTRWPELAGYSLADRLAFLWHWGHGRELGRLV
jgi:hypothetical protein